MLIYSKLNSILNLFWEVLWSTTQFPTKKWKFLLNMTNLGFQNHHWMIKMVPFHRWCTIQSSYWRFWPNNIIKKDLIKKYSFLPSKTMMNANLTTHFSPMFHFYTPWKRQKTQGFLTFSGGIKVRLSALNLVLISASLTYFSPIFLYLYPWRRQKTKVSLTLSGGIEMEHWTKMG